jgi:hypothetical protein
MKIVVSVDFGMFKVRPAAVNQPRSTTCTK